MGVKLMAALLLLAGAARAERNEIRVAEQYGLTFLPLMIMRDGALVEAHARRLRLPAARLTWIKLGAVSSINDALLAGELEFAAGGVPSLVTLWSRTRGTPGEVRGAGALGDVPNELIVSSARAAVLSSYCCKRKVQSVWSGFGYVSAAIRCEP